MERLEENSLRTPINALDTSTTFIREPISENMDAEAVYCILLSLESLARRGIKKMVLIYFLFLGNFLKKLK